MNILKNTIKKLAKSYLSSNSYILWAKRYHGFGPNLSEFLWQFSWEGIQNRSRLRRLHNAYLNHRCFIIGGGPSLAETDLRPLANEITIGSNALFLIFDRMGFIPTFYTVEDNLVAEDRAEQINEITGTTKLFPRALSRFLCFDKNTIFLQFNSKYSDNLNFEFPEFSGRLNKCVYFGGTITYLNLQLAYYIGCREVYLLGVDHNYQLPPDTDINEDKVIISKIEDVNHFHPDYFGPGFRWHNPKVHRMEKAYISAKKFAEKQGMKIYNATKNSKLEVFPRVSYESIIKNIASSKVQ